jgi:hypothetical protein
VDYRSDDYANEKRAWSPWWAEAAWMVGAGVFIAVCIAAGLFSR